MQGEKQDDQPEAAANGQRLKGIIVCEPESPLASRLAPSRDFAGRVLCNDVALGGEADLSHALVELGGAGGGAEGQVCACVLLRVMCLCATALTIPAAA